MAAARKKRVTHKPRKVSVRKPAKAPRSRYWAHRGRSAASLFRAHRGRHTAAFKAHGKRRIAGHTAKHPRVVVVKVRKTAAKKTVGATVASHRCGQPLTHSARRETAATRKKLSTSLRARHTRLSKAEKARISRALKGHHATCACKTVGAAKHQAASHHHLTAKTRARISAKLRKEHAGTKWGKAAKGSHHAATKSEAVRVLKAAKASSGKSKAAAKKPC